MTRDHRADFEWFARTEMDGLLGYAIVLTGDRELARDLVQDVLVKAYVRWPRIAAGDQPRAYVRAMITNAFLSWRRRWSVRNVTASDVLRPPPDQDHATGIADRADVHQRLASLPPKQRAVLVLRFYEGLTDAEIADVLGCAVGTVRSNASRGLATLRAPGDQDDPGPEQNLPSTPSSTDRSRSRT